MTLALAGDPVSGEAPLRAWHPMLSSRAPGFAVALPMADRLRLVVLDLSGCDRLDARVIREVSHPAIAAASADLADQLIERHLDRSRCSSVAIADLLTEGSLELQVRAAPPALLLSPGKPARLLPGAGSEAGGRLEPIAAGDVLVLCSASFLEDPPAVLGTVRRPPADDTGLAHLRHQLRACGHRGATASVTIPPG